MNATKLHSELLTACTGGMSALRTIVSLAPIGGDGDKVAPPTYKGGKYASEKRVGGVEADELTVLLDSVQSQANRFEEAILNRIRSGEIRLPLIEVDIPGYGTLTSLSVPHRVHDAILRDSNYKGKPFRDSDSGKQMVEARTWNARAMFRACPTALLFGTWDSQGQGGVASAKFARALVSEIVALGAKVGTKTSSRIDALGIKGLKKSIFTSGTEQWTLETASGELYGKKKESLGTPASINHGNIPPTVAEGEGGVTFREARQTAVLSFAQIRKLRFPETDESTPAVDVAGRAVVAALGVVALALQIEEGYQLRSRCQLIPVEAPKFEWLGRTVAESHSDEISTEAALGALDSLSAHAKSLGLIWEEDPIRLEPQKKLLELIKKSEASTAVED